MSDKFIIEWSKKDYEVLNKNLSEDNYKYFINFCDKYKTFCSSLNKNVKDTTAIMLLKKDVPSFYLIESKFFLFHYTYVYKLRNICRSFSSNINSRNFLSASIILRSMLETTCLHSFILKRIDNLLSGIKDPRSVGEKLHEVNKVLQQSHTGTSINWEKIFGSDYKFNVMENIRVIEAIRDTSKFRDKRINTYYELLSEITHPNFGSNALVIQNNGREDELKIERILGDGDGPDTFIFFFEILSETLLGTINLTANVWSVSTDYARFFRNLTDVSKDKPTDLYQNNTTQ